MGVANLNGLLLGDNITPSRHFSLEMVLLRGGVPIPLITILCLLLVVWGVPNRHRLTGLCTVGVGEPPR